MTYIHGDHLGSTSLTTNSSGASVSQQEFDPWGKVRSGNISQTSMSYTGQKLDGTGLLFYNARYYDPAIGRFTSADSMIVGAGQNFNRYSYVNNDPINHNDPSGHCLKNADGGRNTTDDNDCWNLYDEIKRKNRFDYDPAGLDDWGLSPLNYLMSMLNKGVIFTSYTTFIGSSRYEGLHWKADEINQVLQAIGKVSNFLKGRTDKALSCNALRFRINF